MAHVVVGRVRALEHAAVGGHRVGDVRVQDPVSGSDGDADLDGAADGVGADGGGPLGVRRGAHVVRRHLPGRGVGARHGAEADGGDARILGGGAHDADRERRVSRVRAEQRRGKVVEDAAQAAAQAARRGGGRGHRLKPRGRRRGGEGEHAFRVVEDHRAVRVRRGDGGGRRFGARREDQGEGHVLVAREGDAGDQRRAGQHGHDDVPDAERGEAAFRAVQAGLQREQPLAACGLHPRGSGQGRGADDPPEIVGAVAEAVGPEGVGPVREDLLAVGQPVAVRVPVPDGGAVDHQLFPVGQPVAVRVGDGRVEPPEGRPSQLQRRAVRGDGGGERRVRGEGAGLAAAPVLSGDEPVGDGCEAAVRVRTDVIGEIAVGKELALEVGPGFRTASQHEVPPGDQGGAVRGVRRPKPPLRRKEPRGRLQDGQQAVRFRAREDGGGGRGAPGEGVQKDHTRRRRADGRDPARQILQAAGVEPGGQRNPPGFVGDAVRGGVVGRRRVRGHFEIMGGVGRERQRETRVVLGLAQRVRIALGRVEAVRRRRHEVRRRCGDGRQLRCAGCAQQRQG